MNTMSGDDLPPWPWPEYENLPYEEPLPPWPRPEHSDMPLPENCEDERRPETSEREDPGDLTYLESSKSLILDDDDLQVINSYRAQHNDIAYENAVDAKPPTPAYSFDAVDSLDVRKNTITKLLKAGYKTVADLIHGLGGDRPDALSDYIVSVVVTHLQTVGLPIRYESSEDQLEALQQLSDYPGFGFDMFGALTRFAESAASQSASRKKAAHASGDLGDIVKDDVLLRRLRIGGVTTLSDLLSMSDEQLLAIRGFGQKKLQKVRYILESYDFAEGSDADRLAQDAHEERFEDQFNHDEKALVKQALKMLDPDSSIFVPEAFSITMLPFARQIVESGVDADAQASALVDAFWAVPGITDCCRAFVRKAIELTETRADKKPCFPANSRWSAIVREEVRAGGFDYDEQTGSISPHVMSLDEWLNSLPNKDEEILRMRYEGATLEAVGNDLEVTRERVRQIQSRAQKGKPQLREDSLCHLVDTYAIRREDFIRITGCASIVYGYLDAISTSPRSSRLPLPEAIDDEEIAEDIRTKIATTKVAGYALVDGKLVPAQKLDITLAILEQFGSGNPMSLPELLRHYEGVLRENDVENEPGLSPTSERAYGAWLSRQPGILYAPLPRSVDPDNRSIRLYGYSKTDLKPLVDYLESGEYANIDCSSALIFKAKSFARIKAALDIRNEYELHTIIRYRCGQIKDLELGRCPMLRFGTASRVEQLTSLVRELGPISASDLSRAYENAYGVDAFTVELNYLKDISGLLVDDLYEIANDRLSTEQKKFLKSILVRTVQTISSVRERFADRFPDAPASSINMETLKECGFELRRELVVPVGFNTTRFAKRAISSVDHFKVGDPGFPEELFGDVDFRGVLSMYLRQFEIVEIAQGEYESLDSLQQKLDGITADVLSDYIDAICRFIATDEVETIRSLKGQGFEHPLHQMLDGSEYGDGFLAGVASIGYVGGRLKRTRQNGTLLLSKRNGSLTVVDFVESAIRRTGLRDARALHAAIIDIYGVRMSGGHLRQCLFQLEDRGFDANWDSGTDDRDMQDSARHELDVRNLIADGDDNRASDANQADDEVGELPDLITEIVNKGGRMPIARLMSQLKRLHGIDETAVKVRAAAKMADIDFDERRDFVSAKQ